MINNIQFILQQIKISIPAEILDLAFRDDASRFTTNGNIDQMLEDRILYQYVMQDCNIFAGQLQKIPLDDTWIESADMPYGTGYDRWTIYRIPPQARDNRRITRVIEITPAVDWMRGAGGVPATTGLNFKTLAEVSLNSHNYHNNINMPNAVLLDGDLIQVDTIQNFGYNWLAVCQLEYNINFENVEAGNVKWIAEMAIQMTKRYIYNKLLVSINTGILILGRDASIIKDTINSYADAADKYNDALNNFRGASLFDKQSKRELYKLLL
jgi:hypothetical protein